MVIVLGRLVTSFSVVRMLLCYNILVYGLFVQSSLRASEADKHRMMDRITKLEDELRNLRVSNRYAFKKICLRNYLVTLLYRYHEFLL